MYWIAPTLVLLATVIVVRPVLLTLKNQGFTRVNYREKEVIFPAGIAVIVAVVAALVPLQLIALLTEADLFRSDFAAVVTYSLGIAFFGLLDDLLDAAPRGLRGHGAAVANGSFSTGIMKAVAALGLALLCVPAQSSSKYEYLISVALVVVSTNLFNLLDLRPGRAIKTALAVLVVGCLIHGSVEALGQISVVLAPFLLLLIYDLRERVMLGDVGSNVVGGLVGFWFVLTLGGTGELITLLLLTFITIYGEFRSISELVQRSKPLRWLDSLGRPDA